MVSFDFFITEISRFGIIKIFELNNKSKQKENWKSNTTLNQMSWMNSKNKMKIYKQMLQKV